MQFFKRMDLSYNVFEHIVSLSIYHTNYRSRANLRFGVTTFPLNHAPTRDYFAESNVEWIQERGTLETYTPHMRQAFPLSVFSFPFRANNSECTKGPNRLSLDLLRRMFRLNIPETLYNASFLETSQYRHVSMFSFAKILISYVPALL